MTSTAYLNGRFVPECEARLSPQDAGFMFGATVVDNARTYGGVLFRWNEHLDRFFADCHECGVPLNATRGHLTSVATELIRPKGGASQLQDRHVVTVATPGPPGGPPTLMMTTYPIRLERYRPFFLEGVTLSLAGQLDIPGGSLFPISAKHRSRMHWYRAEQIVKGRNQPNAVPVIENLGTFDTAIGGIVGVRADGTILFANTRFVQRSISVAVLNELATKLGLRTTQGQFRWDDADLVEVLLCGTGFGIAGVSRLFGEERLLREFVWPGEMCRQLTAAWSELVGIDIVEQFVESRSQS